MPNRTRINRPISTIAWPLCEARLIFWSRERVDAIEVSVPLVAVLGAVDGVGGDDHPVADGLLNQRRQRLEVEPQRDLDGLVAGRGGDGVAARSWGGQNAKTTTRSVRRAVAGSG